MNEKTQFSTALFVVKPAIWHVESKNARATAYGFRTIKSIIKKSKKSTAMEILMPSSSGMKIGFLRIPFTVFGER